MDIVSHALIGRLLASRETPPKQTAMLMAAAALPDLFQIPLVSFNGDNMLKRMDGGAFAETAESGPPVMGASGRILSQSLEGSNVDISEEFTKLIITQQAYAANTRIVTTSNSMLQETINMIR